MKPTKNYATMKKYLSLPIIVLILATTVALGSCTHGSDKSILSKKVLTTTISIEASPDLIAASDIEITYKGKGGVDVTDTISATRWEQRIVNDSFPTLVGIVGYRLLPKPNPKFDNDRAQLHLMISLEDLTADWVVSPIQVDNIASARVPDYLASRLCAIKNSDQAAILPSHLAHEISLNDNGDFTSSLPNTSNNPQPSKATEQ